MQVFHIGSRGIVFSFDLGGSPTNVYVIEGPRHRFICDTFLGPAAIEQVLSYCKARHGDKEPIVFNSHAHWDHVWGNCFFPGSLIIGHTLCAREIPVSGESQLKEYGKYAMGEVRLVAPNVTFDSRLFFEEEGVEFFFSPGHTPDSASCLDRRDRILFVGDNLEEPVPYLFNGDLDSYRSSLLKYKMLEPIMIVAGHGELAAADLLDRNLRYVEQFMRGDAAEYEQGPCARVHQVNCEAARERAECGE